MRTRPQLITYPDSLGGSLRSLDELLRTRLAGCFSGVHVLPPFPSSGDRGFAPLTYERIDPRFGTWEDVARIARAGDLALDLIVNHVSRRSPEFADFERRGRSSPHADRFLTLDKVWPGGEPDPDDLARIHLRRPRPWSSFTILETGASERVWTTFGRDDPSEQIDLDVRSPAARAYLAEQLERFAVHGVRLVRLDAVGYVAKRAGTSCFMVRPDVEAFLAWARSVADPLGLELLTEVHAPRTEQHRLVDTGCWVYDFVLPGLVLHALRTCSADRLAAHLATSPSRQITTLDSHDGIPVQPDLDGILTVDESRALVDECLARGANLSRLYTTAGRPDPAFDAHQVNIAYAAAVGSEDAYVLARAIQLFAPGVPQVYYVGLLAGDNDHAAVASSGEGRAINRRDYARAEIDAALERPVVRRILRLLRLRHDHPAFEGELAVAAEGPRLRLSWSGTAGSATLEADLAAGSGLVDAVGADGTRERFAA